MNKVRAGYKMTELGEIPNEWKIKKLGEIAIGKGEYGIGASASEYVEGKPRYLRITDIGDGCKLLFNDIKGLDEKEYEKYILKELEEDDEIEEEEIDSEIEELKENDEEKTEFKTKC